MDEEIEISKHTTTEEMASEADHWKATAEGLQDKLDTLFSIIENLGKPGHANHISEYGLFDTNGNLIETLEGLLEKASW